MGIVKKFVHQMLVIAMIFTIISVLISRDEGTITDEMTPLAVGTRISKMEMDVNVIPDKYNTGCKGQLKSLNIIDGKAEVNGVIFGTSKGYYGPVLTFDYNKNKNLRGTIVFENIDFSGYVFTPYRNSNFSGDVRLVFNNCKFGMFMGYTNSEKQKSYFEFNNCHIDSFSGSNASFERCSFGQSFRDGIRPFQNIKVTNCLFYKFESTDTAGGGYHTDGMQTFGDAMAEVRNVLFDNCRFECPSLGEGCSANVNACIMIQLEYNNADGIYVKNSILNGGGYTIFARGTGKNIELRNVELSNINVGAASLYGVVYPDVADNVVFSNLSGTSSLYVGSVWKDAVGTHISVSNDTSIERKLLVVTNNGEYEYTVDACPVGNQLGTVTEYDSFPFDIDIVVPGDSDYVLCYDITSSNMKQIRFENYSEKPVYGSAYVSTNNIKEENRLESGQCGKNVYYYITDEGKLVIYGKGTCYDYHSKKVPPWDGNMKNFIRSIEVQDGVTSIGNQMFNSCMMLEHVSLAQTVSSIGSRSFYKCYMLQDINLPKSITSIGGFAFDKTLVNKVIYEGTQEEWENVKIGEGNQITIN